MAEAAAASSVGQDTMAGGGAAANGASWADSFDADTKGWVSGKAWDKLEPNAALAEAVKLGRAAEQKLGVPADQIIRLPGKDAKPEDWRGVWSKLGAPEKPEDYEIKPPEGHPDEFAKTAAGWFHELGVPKTMASGIAGKWNEYIAAQQEADIGRWNERFEKETAELKTEWAADYDKNRDLARRVEKATGLQDDQLKGIERALGPKAYQQFLSRFGKNLGEHRFLGGDGQKSFGMSSEAALSRIEALNKDTAWQKARREGDADKQAEWTKLHEAAYGTALANQNVDVTA